ncbi:hypothetical protein BaRGS_00012902 [Batillaria attramentaria]|uniref:Uncharacterized protein n=1 Tax=Batillaria attramentaria TaxID=370345 RepID=A0ABD0L9S7_9CAEN
MKTDQRGDASLEPENVIRVTAPVKNSPKVTSRHSIHPFRGGNQPFIRLNGQVFLVTAWLGYSSISITTLPPYYNQDRATRADGLFEQVTALHRLTVQTDRGLLLCKLVASFDRECVKLLPHPGTEDTGKSLQLQLSSSTQLWKPVLETSFRERRRKELTTQITHPCKFRRRGTVDSQWTVADPGQSAEESFKRNEMCPLRCFH